MIMNDLILDVSRYQTTHPGGQFLLEKNLGRDIAKYYDGGYTMENSNGQKPIRHTYQARAIID